jgi:hypothetical protein
MRLTHLWENSSLFFSLANHVSVLFSVSPVISLSMLLSKSWSSHENYRTKFNAEYKRPISLRPLHNYRPYNFIPNRKHCVTLLSFEAQIDVCIMYIAIAMAVSRSNYVNPLLPIVTTISHHPLRTTRVHAATCAAEISLHACIRFYVFDFINALTTFTLNSFPGIVSLPFSFSLFLSLSFSYSSCRLSPLSLV